MTSPAKILDNAIVGYCVHHGLRSANTRRERVKRAQYQPLKKRAQELGLWEEIEAKAKRAAAIPQREH